MLGKPADGYWWLGAANYNKFVRVMGHSESKAWEDWQYFQAANSIASWSVRADSPYQTFEDVIEAAGFASFEAVERFTLPGFGLISSQVSGIAFA